MDIRSKEVVHFFLPHWWHRLVT